MFFFFFPPKVRRLNERIIILQIKFNLLMLTHQQTHKLHTQIVMTMNLTYKARDILFKQSIADIVIYSYRFNTIR